MRSVDPWGTTRSIFAAGFAAASVARIASASFSFLFNAGTHIEGGASGAGASRQPPYFCSVVACCDSVELVCAETVADNNGRKKMGYTMRQGQGINKFLKASSGGENAILFSALTELTT